MNAKVDRWVVGLLAVVAILCASRLNYVPPIGHRPLPTHENGLGLIEHRGRYYPIQQVLDPLFRQTSSDSFPSRFNGDSTYAAEAWAGMNPEEDFPRGAKTMARNNSSPRELKNPPQNPRSAVQSLPWAGRNPIDHHD